MKNINKIFAVLVTSLFLATIICSISVVSTPVPEENEEKPVANGNTVLLYGKVRNKNDLPPFEVVVTAVVPGVELDYWPYSGSGFFGLYFIKLPANNIYNITVCDGRSILGGVHQGYIDTFAFYPYLEVGSDKLQRGPDLIITKQF
jgi:hypothetical protein